MRLLTLLLTGTFLLTGCTSFKVDTAEFMDSITEPSTLKTMDDTETLPFRIYAPKTFSRFKDDTIPSDEKFPVCIYLHDDTECGTNNLAQLTNGFDRIVKFIIDNEEEMIAIAPQCPEGSQWKDPQMVEHVYELIESLVAKDNVDTSRIYLTGFGMGGEGVWYFALKYPLAASAFAPVCGGSLASKSSNTVRVPLDLDEANIWSVSYLDDRVRTSDLAKKIVRSVWIQSVALTRFTEFPKGGHTSEIYSDENFMGWLFSTRKDIKSNFDF